MTRIVKIILFNLVTSSSLLFSADVPNWSFNDIHNGWNSESLTKLYFHYSDGVGTCHHLNDYVCSIPLQFSRCIVHIPQYVRPKMDKISSIENRQMLKSRL